MVVAPRGCYSQGGMLVSSGGSDPPEMVVLWYQSDILYCIQLVLTMVSLSQKRSACVNWTISEISRQYPNNSQRD